MPCDNNCTQACVCDTNVDDLYPLYSWVDYSIVVVMIVSSTAALGFFVGYVT
jgi:hypothetical protein